MKFLPKNYLPKVWDFCGECGSVGQGWPLDDQAPGRDQQELLASVLSGEGQWVRKTHIEKDRLVGKRSRSSLSSYYLAESLAFSSIIAIGMRPR